MSISWHWAWGPETMADLVTHYGWSRSHTNNIVPTSTAGEVYTYAGSPTRYSMNLGNNRTLNLPPKALPASAQGWVVIPVRNTLGNVLDVGARFISITGGAITRTELTVAGGGQSLNLFVDNVFKETTLPIQWSDWKYVAFKFDMSTNPWSAQLFIDGVAATASYTEAHAVDVVGSIAITGVTNGGVAGLLVGQVLIYDAIADSGEVPRFVTRVEPNADGTNIGTWTPSVGGTDFGVLDTPLDDTTYTEEPTPSASDRVEVLTNGGGSDLDTALGTTTSAIDSVMVHGYSTGQAVTSRAIVGDGTASETAGPNELISVGSTSTTEAVANTKPSGGAWAGADTPEYIYEVVSV